MLNAAADTAYDSAPRVPRNEAKEDTADEGRRPPPPPLTTPTSAASLPQGGLRKPPPAGLETAAMANLRNRRYRL